MSEEPIDDIPTTADDETLLRAIFRERTIKAATCGAAIVELPSMLEVADLRRDMAQALGEDADAAERACLIRALGGDPEMDSGCCMVQLAAACSAGASFLDMSDFQCMTTSDLRDLLARSEHRQND